MTPFDAPGKQTFWKHCGKRRNCSERVFSTRLENCLLFSSNPKLSSADCFNLELSKILSSGNGLNDFIYKSKRSNAAVAFVKGADERKEFFEKLNSNI